MAARSITGSSAACRSSTVVAAATAFLTVSVSFRSARSWSHFSRLSAGSASSASRSTAVGAPCFFCALIATERPVAVSSRKPIIVS